MPPEPIHKVRFTPRRVPLLDNPHKGCATFQRFGGDPLNRGTRWSEEGPLAFPEPGAPPPAGRLQDAPWGDVRLSVADGYLPSTVAYCRWFWEVLEPEPGRLDFAMVEQALRVAHERGQTLQVRLMPHGSQGQPQLPAWYQARYATRPGGSKPGRTYLEADYDSAEYFDTWGRVIAEFAMRFDGDPRLESVDLAFVGPWGEGAGPIGAAQVERFVDLYVRAHRHTRLLVNIDEYQFVAGMARGTGWRCDCFGDLGFFGRRWNHTYDAYPRAVVRAGAQDRWRTQPLTLETCGVPWTWREHGFDLDFILAQGLKMHGSVFMPKSNAIPGEWIAPLARFCDAAGYRFVLRQAEWPRRLPVGGGLPVRMWVENTGTAPIYGRVRLVLRLQGAHGQHLLPLSAAVSAWLPGDAWVEETVALPPGIGRGLVRIAAGLVQAPALADAEAVGPPGAGPAAADLGGGVGPAPVDLAPHVRFAVDESDAEGWVPLGEVEIV